MKELEDKIYDGDKLSKDDLDAITWSMEDVVEHKHKLTGINNNIIFLKQAITFKIKDKFFQLPYETHIILGEFKNTFKSQPYEVEPYEQTITTYRKKDENEKENIGESAQCTT